MTMCDKETADPDIQPKTNSHKTNEETEQPEPSPYTDICRFVFDQSTDAIMVSDFNGDLCDVNASCCTKFGYSKDELLGSNVRKLLDPEHIKANPIRFDLLAAGRNTFYERKMVHKDGTIIYVEANAKKIAADRILVIARDITAIKKTDTRLKRSEANLHTILDTTDTIYVLMDDDLRIISYNSRAAAFASNELGHNIEISEYVLDYFPADKRTQLLHYMEAVLTGKHINYEVSYPQPGGSVNWYYVRFFPISKGDNVYGLMMAVSDITEKKVLEQKLEEERLRKQMEITDAVITAEENERNQIGIELHDNVNQLLAASRLFLGMAKQSKGIKYLHLMNEVDKHIETAIDEIRNLSHSMISPFLEEFGFFGFTELLSRNGLEMRRGNY